MKIKNTIKNVIRALSWTIITLMLIVLILIYLDVREITIISLSFFVVITLPELILICRYYIVSKNYQYEFIQTQLIIHQKGDIIKVNKDDIKSLKLVKPANLDDGWSIHFLGITCYFYIRMELKNGDLYFLTNLQNPKIDKLFEENGYSFYREKGIAWL